ncbi:MHS family MFS transporter [Rubrobacter indicoceani]|uniref:MHS family MFS transporter n=1 Tax=Rubrobacter indicoceani TaxID=2051957 RepID=UPI0013C503FB|nr:MHS family MFS transporter [Rubrobacter indicoceani]
MFITFGTAYAVQLGFEASNATTGLLVAQVAALVCVPLAAGISDSIGRRPVHGRGGDARGQLLYHLRPL